MSEWNTIYDTSKEIVGTFRHGAAWCKKTGVRLGEYDETNISDNDGQVIAIINGNSVFAVTGEELGNIEGETLIVNGCVVGSFIGYNYAGAAAIAFLFSQVPNAS